MGKKNTQLFKERITLSNYESLIQELSSAINEGTGALNKLLIGTSAPDLYAKHGTYKNGQHNYCAGLKGESFTEKRLCKCMYYQNSKHTKRCEKCEYHERFALTGDYKIEDYEVPAFCYGDGIGEIDLVISDQTHLYATEIKPYKGNSESLLRMVAEIMTYTLGDSEGKYKKAIAFFEKERTTGERTHQQKEYDKNEHPALLKLMKQADITVFHFVEVDEKTYKICKL